MRHPDVAVGAVVALADPSGSRRLVAYVVPRTGARAVSAGLRERLRVHLPPYMVPSAFVLLDALPITPSGKVDYSALPLPLPDRARTASRSATTLEARVIEAWRQVLEIDEIGPDDDFFALGGHSLLGMLLLIRLHEMLGVELTLSQIFETPTVAGMAELVARRPAAPRRARDGGIESGVL